MAGWMFVAVAEVDVAAAALTVVAAHGEAQGFGVDGGVDGEGIGESAVYFELVGAGRGDGREVGLRGGVSGGGVERRGGELAFEDDGVILSSDAKGSWRPRGWLAGDICDENRREFSAVGKIA